MVCRGSGGAEKRSGSPPLLGLLHYCFSRGSSFHGIFRSFHGSFHGSFHNFHGSFNPLPQLPQKLPYKWWEFPWKYIDVGEVSTAEASTKVSTISMEASNFVRKHVWKFPLFPWNLPLSSMEATSTEASIDFHGNVALYFRGSCYGSSESFHGSNESIHRIISPCDLRESSGSFHGSDGRSFHWFHALPSRPPMPPPTWKHWGE